ncbi:ABC transporter permease [Ferviditalea candida]|uniref:Transport permease protein n=1 Tax=Ferviditalea candida TaxID=3108399 RepID=A0ABU5ZLT1_9BACL|nr:ABC transporter permease [Paenibacillaceae bacterium T2]
MNTFFKHLWIQFKIDIRERGTLMTYYLVPLIFYVIMGTVFSSINPLARQTLAATMVIFAVTMGAVLGTPVPIVKIRESGVLRAYRVCGIPGWAVLFIHAVSAFLHLLIISIFIFVTAPLFFGASYPQSFFAYFLVLFILLFATIALGLFIGAAARNQSIAMMFSQAIFLPTVVLSGIMFPASMLPVPLRMIGRLLPATYIMQSFSVFAFGLPTDMDATLSLLIAACIGVIAAGLTAIRFRAIGKLI